MSGEQGDDRSQDDGGSDDGTRVWNDYGSGTRESTSDTSSSAGSNPATPHATEKQDEGVQSGPVDTPREEALPPRPQVSSIADLKPLYQSQRGWFYLLWLLAALTYGGGDILTTVYAVLGQPGFDELNPVVTALLNRFGIGGFIALKAAVFAVLLGISVKGGIDNDRVSFYGPPILTIAMGVVLTLWNAIGLFTV